MVRRRWWTWMALGLAGCDTVLGLRPSTLDLDRDAGVAAGSSSSVSAGGSTSSGSSGTSSSGSSSVGGATSTSSGSTGSSASTSSSGDGGGSSGSSGTSSSCTPGTQQCASSTAVQTCGSNGQWGSPWSCGTGSCSSGACAGSTATGASCPPGSDIVFEAGAAGGTAGVTNCGAAGGDNCCTSLEVPGGTYDRTYTGSGTGATGEAYPATVSGFRLDEYLVTVGRFRQFVNAWNSGYLPAAGSGKHAHLNGGQGLANSGDPGTYETGWDAADWSNTADVDPTTANLENCGGSSASSYATWTATAGSQENLPINCVMWYEAYAFCIWDGGFLPSEAEWEYAAAGGSEQLEYAWGSTAPGTGNQYAIYNCNYPNQANIYTACTGAANIAPVGTASLGAGLWGQLDMAGEVYEWNLDWYNSSYVDPCTDCAYLTAASVRVARGGDFMYDVAAYLMPPYRFSTTASRSYVYGFRCARTP